MSVQVVSSAPGGGAQWTTGGYDVQNTRYNKTEAAIGVANVGALVQKWRLPTVGDVSARRQSTATLSTHMHSRRRGPAARAAPIDLAAVPL